MTERGEEVAKGIAEKIDRVLEKSSEGITEENLKIFYESLSIICGNLEKYALKMEEKKS